MGKNILPDGAECIFVRQAEQLGLGHTELCEERVVGDDTFAVLLADDFIVTNSIGEMADLNSAYEATQKSQFSVSEINGPDFSVWVLVLNKTHVLVTGLIEAQGIDKALSNIASFGRFLLKPDIFDILRNQKPGVSREIQLTDPINTRGANNVVDTVNLKGRRIDFGSVDVCLDEFIHTAERITADLYTNRF